MSVSKNKKKKHLSHHVDSARVCVDNILDLSAQGIDLLFKIIQITDKNNVIRDDDGNSMQSLVAIAKLINVPHGKTFTELSTKGVFKKIRLGREKGYVVNPYIIHKDSSVSPDIYMEFKDSKYRYVYGEDYFEEVLV